MSGAIGGRSAQRVGRALLDGRQYLGAVRALGVYGAPHRMLWRYGLTRGSYPTRCVLRTPLGPVAPVLYSHHDLLTVHEVFCRRDYGTLEDGAVVLDLGANIGLSALYFLTRGPAVRCHAVEPNPANLERLAATLAGYEGRYAVTDAAVERFDGESTFCVEPSGRYGALGLNLYPERITVRCVDVNGLLEGVLEAEGRIDLLKVDIESSVVPVMRAIRPELLREVRTIVLEAESFPIELPGFERASAGIVHRFKRAGAAPARVTT